MRPPDLSPPRSFVLPTVLNPALARNRLEVLPRRSGRTNSATFPRVRGRVSRRGEQPALQYLNEPVQPGKAFESFGLFVTAFGVAFILDAPPLCSAQATEVGRGAIGRKTGPFFCALASGP